MCHHPDPLMAWSAERTAEAERSRRYGRRVYLHEQALARSGLASLKRCTEMVEVALSLFVPRRIEHALSDMAILGGLDLDPSEATSLVVREGGYRKVQSQFFRSLALRTGSTGAALLGTEEVVANCFFENYFTLATSSEAAKRMFVDNAGMRDLRSRQPEDLSFVRARQVRLTRSQRRAAVEVYGSVEWERLACEFVAHAGVMLTKHVGEDVGDAVTAIVERESRAMMRSLRTATGEQAGSL